MPVTAEMMHRWCRELLQLDPSSKPRSLEEYLAGIPRLDSLTNLAEGTPVLVRGDLDAKPGPQIGEGDIRLRSMLDTLKFGQARGWVQILFGHIGRKPEGTLANVRKRLEELLAAPVTLIDDWLDESSLAIRDTAAGAVKNAASGSVLLLENTRRYAIERALWKATDADLPQLSESFARLAGQFRERLAKVFVNEALSAGSLDFSSTVVPAAMDRVALGSYVAREFDGPMLRCRRTQLVVFSGLKADKLDDLEAMINRGTIRWVITAGSLAMALKKGAAQLDGGDFCMGSAQDPAHSDKPYYIEPKRIEQARRMIAVGRKQGIEFVLPVDFVLGDGRVSDAIGPNELQFDVGPASSRRFSECVSKVIDFQRQNTSGQPTVAFHNGVFGMFEDPRFEEGTRRFIAELKRMHDAGVEVYVGGGEGGTALQRYGKSDWVTHCFTAGGTVLNALGDQPVPYLVAMYMAASGAA